MRVKFNSAAEDIYLKGIMKQLVDEYQDNVKKLQVAVRAENAMFKTEWESDTYLPEYLTEKHNRRIRDLESAAAANAKDLNKRACKAVADLKKKAVAALQSKDRPADIAVRVNNALQFIQLEGEEISDQTAAEILRDFMPYADIMQRFRRVIEQQTASVAPMFHPSGTSRFPLTFGRLDHTAHFLAAIDELEGIARSIFLRDTKQSEVETYNGVRLYVPMSGYTQLVEEINICDQAGKIEDMAGMLFPADM